MDIGMNSDLKMAEVQWDKSKDKRDKIRKELEEIKRRLEVVVDVKMVQADLDEAE